MVVGSAGGQFLADRFTAAGARTRRSTAARRCCSAPPSARDVLGKVAVQADGGIVAAGAESGGVVVVRLTAAGAWTRRSAPAAS